MARAIVQSRIEAQQTDREGKQGWTRTHRLVGKAREKFSKIFRDAADQAWSYDAVGNVRGRSGHANYLTVFGAPAYDSPLFGTRALLYNSMNLMTSSSGIGGTVAVTYNMAGQRMTAIGYAVLTVTIANPAFQPEEPVKLWNQPTIQTVITVDTLKHYAYDAAGNLATVRIAQGPLGSKPKIHRGETGSHQTASTASR